MQRDKYVPIVVSRLSRSSSMFLRGVPAIHQEQTEAQSDAGRWLQNPNQTKDNSLAYGVLLRDLPEELEEFTDK